MVDGGAHNGVMTLWARNRDEDPKTATGGVWHAEAEDLGVRGDVRVLRTACGETLEGLASSIVEQEEAPDPGDGVCHACARKVAG